jgi:hypothetical protein
MKRSQLVLLLVVLGLGTFYFWSKVHRMEQERADYEAKRYFSNREEEQIEAIRVTCKDPKFEYVLRRNGDRWYLDGHLASQEKSPQLVMALVDLTTEKEILADPKPEDLQEFGLDDPTYTIGLTANGGEQLGTVLLGNRTPGGNHFYGRWQQGGAISTVPAYMFSPLEEEPKDLREASPFPIEVNAIDRFEFAVGEEKGKMVRPEGKEQGFEMREPGTMPVDESKVNELMYLLKDLKVARFLEQEEKTDLGAMVASYRAHEKGSTVDFVTEFHQPVAVNPKLRYGRRYLTDEGQSEPRSGTEERFVIELLPDSKALAASVAGFEDRRVQKLDVDRVKLLKLTFAEGAKLTAQRLPQGGWRFTEPESRLEEAEPGPKVDKLLWAVRDLRYSDAQTSPESSGQGEWQLELQMADGSSHNYRFGQDKSGKPFVVLAGKGMLLQQELVPALDDAVQELEARPAASPTPQPK